MPRYEVPKKIEKTIRTSDLRKNNGFNSFKDKFGGRLKFIRRVSELVQLTAILISQVVELFILIRCPRE